jgi:hypothetical protein
LGLDAYVPCNCLARGVAKPPPVEVGIEDGVPYPLVDRDDVAFYAWRDSACAHPAMKVVDERVANWAGVRTLQDALRTVGPPVATLLEHIPDANGGAVPAATAQVCLDELDAFRRLFKRVTIRLVNAKTGEAVYDYVAAYDGVFLWSQDGDVGFDATGIYVMDRKPRRIRFQARRAVAIPVENGCELRDLASGATTRCAWSHTAETSYEVIEHVETAADHDHKLTVLETLFRAAALHDTCVVWC